MTPMTLTRRSFLAATAAAPMASAVPAAAGPVCIGVAGVGSRGWRLLRLLLKQPGARVTAVCDIDPARRQAAVEAVKQACGQAPAAYGKDEHDYRNLAARDDVDGVLVATPILWHAPMAVDAMKAGKHVATEAPGAYTLEGCWDLVKTKEATGKRYMLLENYIYEQHRMMVWNMAQAGVFGRLYYAECAYIHDCRALRFKADGDAAWRGEAHRDRFGSLYPTHSLGPVSKWLGIHQGDRLTSLVSMMSRPAALKRYSADRFGADSPQAQFDWKAGDMCVTLVQTAQGRLITVHYDSDSPRPASIFYVLQGDKGAFDSRRGIYLDGVTGRERWEPARGYEERYEHAHWRERGEQARASGHGGGDYFVLTDFLDMVRNDAEPLVDVYDSAAWSALVPLSAQSIELGGASVPIPDFTSGRWRGATTAAQE